MSKPEDKVQKTHASGTWRAVRSMAVPANVKSVKSNEDATVYQSAEKTSKKKEGDSVSLKARKSPGYFESADPAFSNS